jgi:UDP-glucose 4-epimerase
MQIFLTGAAGFIASHLLDRLLADGHDVTGYDNFSTGQRAFLKAALGAPGFRLHRHDLLDKAALTEAMAGAELVVHMAGREPVYSEAPNPIANLEQNTVATSNVLEAMRATGVKRIGFASAASVYGESAMSPVPEEAPFPVQTSLYGASKAAAEALIAAYCEGFGFQGYIFRFHSVLGERSSSGYVCDLYEQLRAHPGELDVPGDGTGRKACLYYVQDCIDAMLTAIAKASGQVNVFNLGTDESCQVKDAIAWIAGHLGLDPQVRYSGGSADSLRLDCTRIRSLGWKPRLTVREGIARTLDYLDAENRLAVDGCR